MFERFTDQARVAVRLAQEYARQHHARTIRTEHLLIGLLGAPNSTAVELLAERGVRPADIAADVAARRPTEEPDPAALKTLGIDLDEVRRRTEDAFGPGALERAWGPPGRGPRRVGGHIPFEAASKKALELSLREALALKDRYIGAEHLLLGLLRTEEGAQRILAARGVTLAEIRRTVADRHRGSAAG